MCILAIPRNETRARKGCWLLASEGRNGCGKLRMWCGDVVLGSATIEPAQSGHIVDSGEDYGFWIETS